MEGDGHKNEAGKPAGGSRGSGVQQPGLRLCDEVRFWKYFGDRAAAELHLEEGPEDGS